MENNIPDHLKYNPDAPFNILEDDTIEYPTLDMDEILDLEDGFEEYHEDLL